MNFRQYAKDNLLRALDRPEYIQYATGNPYAEVDRDHFLNVGDLVDQLWHIKFNCPSPDAPVIAGWYHDFDRVFVEIRVATWDVDKNRYRDKKIEHSKNSALIFAEWNPLLPPPLMKDVQYLIEKAETGGEKTQDGRYIDILDSFTRSYNLNQAADIISEADGISFFKTIIYSYAKWASPERLENKVKFSFNKLSQEGKSIVRDIQFRDPLIRDLVRTLIL